MTTAELNLIDDLADMENLLIEAKFLLVGAAISAPPDGTFTIACSDLVKQIDEVLEKTKC